MLRKLRAIWHIILSNEYKVYTYRYTNYHPSDEYMKADFASYTFSNETENVDKYIKDIPKYRIVE